MLWIKRVHWVFPITNTKVLSICDSSIVVQSPSYVWLFVTPWAVQTTVLLCLWGSPGKNTRVGCHVLLQGIFPKQELNLRLLLYLWATREAQFFHYCHFKLLTSNHIFCLLRLQLICNCSLLIGFSLSYVNFYSWDQ